MSAAGDSNLSQTYHYTSYIEETFPNDLLEKDLQNFQKSRNFWKYFLVLLVVSGSKTNESIFSHKTSCLQKINVNSSGF